jgi:hypothetical protein
VATGRTRGQGSPIWRSPVFEWGVLAAAVVMVTGMLWREARLVQGQAERAAVVSTLGALRTALVVDHLQVKLKQAQGRTATLQDNPFLLVQSVPQYAGIKSMGQLAEVTPGSWVYDATCPCIGYRPLYPQWLESSPEPVALWFKLEGPLGGPLQLTPLGPYVWQGQNIR